MATALNDDLLLLLLKTRIKSVENWRNYLFSTLLVPYTLFSTVGFWFIYHFMAGVIPNEVVIPLWMNHMTHTSTAIILLIEFLVYKNTLPDKRSAAFGLGIALFIYDSM